VILRCTILWLLLAASAQAAVCDVDARLDAELRLAVAYRCDVPLKRLVLHESRAARYVSDVTLANGAALTPQDDGWPVTSGNGARYRMDLAGLAGSTGRTTALRVGDSVLAPLASWLLEPEAEGPVTVRIAVTGASGLDFAAALDRADGRHVIAGGDIWAAGFTAFGKLARHPIALPSPRGGATLEVVQLDGGFAMPMPELLAWVERSARAVADYYHGFPAERAMLAIVPTQSRRVGFGQVRAGGGVSVMLQIGSDVTREALEEDWVLVHELSHVGMPFLYDRGAWLMEGMATYVEPLIRARAGLRSVEWAWHELQAGMPRGGIYWGGAATLLAADLAMRKRTGGRYGFEHCLREVLWRDGNSTLRWRTQQMIEACDRAVGAPILAELAGQGSVDLKAIWAELGVEPAGESVRLRDDPTSTRLRDAILRGN
jgi:hypothetical protein